MVIESHVVTKVSHNTASTLTIYLDKPNTILLIAFNQR